MFDIDGVLNLDGKKYHNNGRNGIEAHCAENFNYILENVPDLKLVVISSWRYDIINGRMTLRGFESQLMTHGIDCENKIIGYTISDEVLVGDGRTYDYLKQHKDVIRREQILNWVYGPAMRGFPPETDTARRWAVLDDQEFDLYDDNWRHIQPDSKVGLTLVGAEQVISILVGDTEDTIVPMIFNERNHTT